VLIVQSTKKSLVYVRGKKLICSFPIVKNNREATRMYYKAASILNALSFQEPIKGTSFTHDNEDNVDYKNNSNPWPLRYWCSALPTRLSSQLGMEVRNISVDDEERKCTYKKISGFSSTLLHSFCRSSNCFALFIFRSYKFKIDCSDLWKRAEFFLAPFS